VDAYRNSWAAELAAAQAWWREAGVDLAFADEATDWLAGARATKDAASPVAPPKAAPAPPTAPPRIGGARASWPTTLADFGAWWLTEPTVDPAPAARRVLPSGPGHAALMVLVPESERTLGWIDLATVLAATATLAALWTAVARLDANRPALARVRGVA